jgi:hypothetical protein
MDNQVEWIKIKKISNKEMRKNLRKLFFQGILFFGLAYVFMIFMLETMVWFWQSEILEVSAKYLRSWIK